MDKIRPPVTSYAVELTKSDGKVLKHIVLLPLDWVFEEGDTVNVVPFLHPGIARPPEKQQELMAKTPVGGKAVNQPAKQDVTALQKAILALVDLSQPPPEELKEMRERYVKDYAKAGGASCSSCAKNGLIAKYRAELVSYMQQKGARLAAQKAAEEKSKNETLHS